VLSAAQPDIALAVLPCFLADEEPALRRLTARVLATQTLSLATGVRPGSPNRCARQSASSGAVVKQHARLISGVGHSG
jgi:hypothetical protein